MACNCMAKVAHYIGDNDEIEIRVVTALADIVVGVAGIMVNETGSENSYNEVLAPAADRSVTTIRRNIGAGWLRHMQAYLVSGTVTQRSVYVSARIVRNAGAINEGQVVLFAGYLESLFQPSFPFTVHESNIAGQGRAVTITGTNPGAGVEATQTVPVGALWLLKAVRLSLTTDATVATRRVHLIIDDGATAITTIAAQDTQAASLGRNYNFADYAFAPAAVGGEIFVALPRGFVLPAGYRIRTSTANIQAGDDYGAPVYYVEEWLAP